MWADWHRAFPDLTNDIRDLIAAPDRVAVRYRFAGTHLGEAFGIPATGRRVGTLGLVMFRIENGRLVEGWAVDDTYSLLGQLGALA
jgi:predicted ester cyclase